MMATPPSSSTVRTSLKLRLTMPRLVMISAMLLAAMLSVSSTFSQALSNEKSAYTSRSRSLLMTSRVSTFFASSSTPSRARLIFFSPSHKKGMVTMPTVSMPISLLTLAMTGAAPVPVHPPIPAVMNVILVPSSSMCLMSSIVSSAISRACLGMLMAQSSSLRSMMCTGTGEALSDCASVLHSAKLTSCMPSLYMWFTALPPPPPTPMTLMMLTFSGTSKIGRVPLVVLLSLSMIVILVLWCELRLLILPL